jgi:hypothetical protein
MMGKSLQILSGGLLNEGVVLHSALPRIRARRATLCQGSPRRVGVFVQPHWDGKLCVKPVLAWEQILMFAEFTNVKLGQHYVELDAVAAK